MREGNSGDKTYSSAVLSLSCLILQQKSILILSLHLFSSSGMESSCGQTIQGFDLSLLNLLRTNQRNTSNHLWWQWEQRWWNCLLLMVKCTLIRYFCAPGLHLTPELYSLQTPNPYLSSWNEDSSHTVLTSVLLLFFQGSLCGKADSGSTACQKN